MLDSNQITPKDIIPLSTPLLNVQKSPMTKLTILEIGVTTPKIHMIKVHKKFRKSEVKVFFTGEAKTTGNQGGGEREVRNDTLKKQRTVGLLK